MMEKRNIAHGLAELALTRKKMAWISGPRQCGKTTLAKSLLCSEKTYFNWDQPRFKAQWRLHPEEIADIALQQKIPRLVLDEIHKNQKWKNQVKAFYDHYGENIEMILTGSARLNTYRKGADSLMGRFMHFHLHPFTLGELCSTQPISFADLQPALLQGDFAAANAHAKDASECLWRWSGFPEPFTAQSQRVYSVWSQNRVELLVRQDLRDLSRLLDLSQVEVLASILPERIGAPLSVQSLREDLDVAHTTASRWLKALHEVYYHFELKPFTARITRSLKKESKVYLYDWAMIADEGKRFENMVACHLLKLCHYYTDLGYGQLRLHYLRDKEKREVDFLISDKGKPLASFEAKLSQLTVNPDYQRFQKQLQVPHYQIVKTSDLFRRHHGDTGQAFVISFARLFAWLP